MPSGRPARWTEGTSEIRTSYCTVVRSVCGTSSVLCAGCSASPVGPPASYWQRFSPESQLLSCRDKRDARAITHCTGHGTVGNMTAMFWIRQVALQSWTDDFQRDMKKVRSWSTDKNMMICGVILTSLSACKRLTYNNHCHSLVDLNSVYGRAKGQSCRDEDMIFDPTHRSERASARKLS